jgi:hypothetical protein
MLAYHEASVDLLRKGSFGVIPPSVVDTPYKYLVGLDELAFLSSERYAELLSTLLSWKQTNNLIKKVAGKKLTSAKALESLAGQNPTPEIAAYFQQSVDRVESHSGQT